MSVDRARMLGSTIDCDTSLTSGLINGVLLPDWDLLLKLCDVTQLTPGYFLNDNEDQFPPGTRLVKALGTGEDIVVNLPASGRAWGEADDEWNYLRAAADMGFGIVKGDYVVAYRPREADVPAIKDALFLAGENNRFEIYRCSDPRNGAVILTPGRHKPAGEMPHVLRLRGRGRGHTLSSQVIEASGFYYFGIVAAIIRPPDISASL